ncbi:hypothetical protein P8631_20265, partial [Guyparkeria sp. 1SP6A2]|nr:hypothetical protein [Guyparkeria sp. 1SP6A2]
GKVGNLNSTITRFINRVGKMSHSLAVENRGYCQIATRLYALRTSLFRAIPGSEYRRSEFVNVFDTVLPVGYDW